MPTRPAAVVGEALKAKGMDCDDGHHHMYRKTVDGVTHMVTRISHNAHEINDDLGKRMANQLCLQLREFWRLVDCPLTEDEWDALVAERCPDGRNPFMNRR
jgi:hypothetical protein